MSCVSRRAGARREWAFPQSGWREHSQFPRAALQFRKMPSVGRCIPVLLCLFPRVLLGGPIYGITGVPLGSGLSGIIVAYMNDPGQIIGQAFTYVDNGVSNTNFLYTPELGVTNLQGNGPLPIPSVDSIDVPVAINNSGQVLTRRGLLFTPGVGVSDLVPDLAVAFPGEMFSFRGMNNRGQAVALGDLRIGANSVGGQILLVTPGDGYEVIASGDSRSFGGGGYLAVNDFGDVLYNVGFPPGTAVIHKENGQTIHLDCGNPGGLAYAINNQGQVAGSYQVNGFNNPAGFPFLCSAATPGVNLIAGMTQYVSGGASAINNKGQLVGSVRDRQGNGVPVLFDSGQVIELNDLLPPGSGWQLITATAINDASQIAGTGVFNGTLEAYVLTPSATATVPEPGSALLITGGCWLLILLLSHRRESCLGDPFTAADEVERPERFSRRIRRNDTLWMGSLR